MEINVSYDGKYPSYCMGVWKITIGDKEFKTEKYQSEEFGTYGIFQTWHFDKDWNMHWDSYEDGNHLEEWVETVKEEDTNGLYTWLKANFKEEEIDGLLYRLYGHIQSRDYRGNSCGGCS